MYYANINSQKISDSAGTAYSITKYKPVFTFGTKTKFELQIVDNSGNPVALNASDTFTFALDNNFVHTDSLMCYSSDSTVTDAEKGMIEIMVDSNTIPFETKIGNAASITAWLEIARYVSGSTDPELIVQDQCTCRNRVHTTEDAPSAVEVGYYTASQVDSLISGLSDRIEDIEDDLEGFETAANAIIGE